MKDIRFLSVGNVLRLHERTIEKQGGSPGVRDRNLLDSAVSAPQHRWGGEYLHPDLPAMAAAYLYHISNNHPFVDGNKRAGTLSCLLFLRKNGLTLPKSAELEAITLAVAGNKMSKEELTDWLRANCRAEEG